MGTNIKIIIAIMLSMFLFGCDLFVPKRDTFGGSSLIYRHITPIQSDSEINVDITRETPKKIESSITNAEWIKDLKYKDIGIGVSSVVTAITAPGAFPFSLMFATIDPICSIFTQARDVELKRLDGVARSETEEIYAPKNTRAIKIKRGDLEVCYESQDVKVGN